MKRHGVASSRARRCLWTLEEVGADYEFQRIDFAAGEHRRDLRPGGSVADFAVSEYTGART